MYPIINQAWQSVEFLKSQDVIKVVLNILKITLIFLDMLNVYRLRSAMIEDVPRIFEAVFAWTLEMIMKNFEDYLEHQLKFFSLLRAIASHCLPAGLSPQVIIIQQLCGLINRNLNVKDWRDSLFQQLKLIMDSIIWAFRHTERNVAGTCLNLLIEISNNFQPSMFCNQFHQA